MVIGIFDILVDKKGSDNIIHYYIYGSQDPKDI